MSVPSANVFDTLSELGDLDLFESCPSSPTVEGDPQCNMATYGPPGSGTPRAAEVPAVPTAVAVAVPAVATGAAELPASTSADAGGLGRVPTVPTPAEQAAMLTDLQQTMQQVLRALSNGTAVQAVAARPAVQQDAAPSGDAVMADAQGASVAFAGGRGAGGGGRGGRGAGHGAQGGRGQGKRPRDELQQLRDMKKVAFAKHLCFKCLQPYVKGNHVCNGGTAVADA